MCIDYLLVGALPPPLDEYVEFDLSTSTYYPIFFFNEYWNLGADYIPLNETVTHVNLSITYTPMSLFKWQLYASQQMRNKLVFRSDCLFCCNCMCLTNNVVLLFQMVVNVGLRHDG